MGINHWFSLIRPAIRVLFLGGGSFGGGTLDCHEILQSASNSFKHTPPKPNLCQHSCPLRRQNPKSYAGVATKISKHIHILKTSKSYHVKSFQFPTILGFHVHILDLIPIRDASHHQDYYIGSRESRTKPSFAIASWGPGGRSNTYPYEPRKKPSYFLLHWMVNRDPYNGLL